ncbi:TadE/TadG family type IV pilus assembly protein [Henriciella litoralis]|uniref:TadE/TadG family type IV pilus assembly protein n=1 Tax=Henriciella litoralis TaxID=568102 RepID=UPI0009FFACDC|nr:TadE/TadG family type IV pilus assembly protein [Henriciella litoralis]
MIGKFRLRRWQRSERGIAAVEAALVAPVLLFAGLAVIDGAYLMLTIHKIESGLSAGAAYLSRSPAPASVESFGRNVAVKGNPAGTGDPIVKDWSTDDVTVTIQSVANTGGEDGGDTVLRGGDAIYVVRMQTRYEYDGLGLLKLVGLGDLELSGFHEERAFGAR